MRQTWRLAPLLFHVGEAENYYRHMASRGLHLRKMGTYLDRYAVGEPADRQYRIEIARPGGMPEEQLDLYEACGWEAVAECAEYYVFAADTDSAPPEIHTDPEMQRRTVTRLIRSAWMGLAALALWVAWFLVRAGMLDFAFWGSVVEGMGLVTFVLVLMSTTGLWVAMQLRTAWILSRRLREGIPVDHGADWRPVRRRQIRVVVLTGCLLAACGLWGLAEGHERQVPLPEPGENSPILCLAEVENVERTHEKWFGGEPDAGIKMRSTLLARCCWKSYERAVDSAAENGYDAVMYQDYYELRVPALAEGLMQALIAQATFADAPDSYREIVLPGMDRVLVSSMELVARRGGQVAYVTYLGDASMEEVAAALAAKWNRQAAAE